MTNIYMLFRTTNILATYFYLVLLKNHKLLILSNLYQIIILFKKIGYKIFANLLQFTIFVIQINTVKK